MSVELHCPGCSKLIRAPDDAGGKHGKCPYCKQSVYIPMPADDSDDIAVSPVDEEEKRRAEALREESLRYTAAVSKAERAEPDADAPDSEAVDASRPVAAAGEVLDIPNEVERFVAAMRDSKLDEADRVVASLEKARTRARDYVEGLLLDEMPPIFKDVPPPLLKGFLKKLLERLSG